MVGEAITPTDQLTGLPLPILPEEPSKEGSLHFRDYHHHFHPRLDPLLIGVQGKPLRFCRGQMVERNLHLRYHDIFRGPQLPTSEREIFRICVLGCAGVMPRRAIDLSTPGEYREAELSDEQFQGLSSPNSLHIERGSIKNQAKIRRRIGKYFAEYALKQDVRSEISDKVIKEFLYRRTSPERKKVLGNFILRTALALSVDEVTLLYRELRREGYVSPGQGTAPAEIIRKFLPNHRFPDYHQPLAERLAIELQS